MPKAGTVNVNLVTNTAAFLAGMNQATGAVENFGSTIKKAIGAYLGYETIKKTADWIHQTMESVDQQSKLADSLGVTTEALAALNYSASLAGVSSEQLSGSMMKMEEHLSGVGGESAKVKEGLKAMHLTMQDLQGKSANEQLGIIADGMNRLTSSSDRAKAGADIFGKGYAAMLPLLAEGSAAMAAEAREAEQLGLTFSRVDGAKIEAANDAMTRAGAVMQGALLQAAKELSPLIEGVANYLVEAAKNAGGFGQIAHTAMEYLVKGIAVGADALNALQMMWYGVKTAVYVVISGLAEFGIAASTIISRAIELFTQFGTALGSFGRHMSREFSVMWGNVRLGCAEAIEFMGDKFARLLDHVETTVRFYNNALADSIGSAADDIIASTSGLADSSRESLKIMEEDAEFTSQAMKDSFSHIGDMSDANENPAVKFFTKIADGAKAGAEESAHNFLVSFNKVLDQDGSNTFNDWYQDQARRSQENAELVARNKAAQVEADKAAAAAKLTMDRQGAEAEKENLNKALVQLEEDYQKRLDALKVYHDQSLLSDAEFKQAQRVAQEQHEVDLANMHKTQAEKQRQWDKKTTADKLDFAAQTFGNLASLMQTHSKRAFEIGKLAAYAQAIVSTAAGIARQFADLPIYIAWAAAAAVAAAGAVQISAIAQTRFDGGGGSPSVGGGGSVGGSVGGAAGGSFGPNSTTPGVTGQAQQGLRIDISGLEDHSVYSGTFVRKLIERINQEQADGSPVTTVGVQ